MEAAACAKRDRLGGGGTTDWCIQNPIPKAPHHAYRAADSMLCVLEVPSSCCEAVGLGAAASSVGWLAAMPAAFSTTAVVSSVSLIDRMRLGAVAGLSWRSRPLVNAATVGPNRFCAPLTSTMMKLKSHPVPVSSRETTVSNDLEEALLSTPGLPPDGAGAQRSQQEPDNALPPLQTSGGGGGGGGGCCCG